LLLTAAAPLATYVISHPAFYLVWILVLLTLPGPACLMQARNRGEPPGSSAAVGCVVWLILLGLNFVLGWAEHVSGRYLVLQQPQLLGAALCLEIELVLAVSLVAVRRSCGKKAI
jgi:hypothetical protein